MYINISIYKYPGSAFWDFGRDGWCASVHRERVVYMVCVCVCVICRRSVTRSTCNDHTALGIGHRSKCIILYQNRLSDINGLSAGQTELIMTRKKM